MFKRTVMLSMSLCVILSLGACTSSKTNDSTLSTVEKDTATVSVIPGSEIIPSEGDDVVVVDGSSILIAYFSWSGNTKQLAEEIQTQAGGELFEIIPETPYTENINELSGISLQEQRNDIRPPLSTQVDDMDQYDVVFIGFPNWWNNAPMPVFTFLEQYDFSDKTVIPFSTYGEGGWGRSISSIEEKVGSAIVAEGLAVRESELSDAPTKVTEWLSQLGFAQ